MRLDAGKSALFGFLGWGGIAFALFLALYFGAAFHAELHVAEVRSFLIEDSRWVASTFGLQTLQLLAAHWLLAGLLGRGSVARIQSANVVLLFAMICILALTLNRYFYWAETYCDVLPNPHEGFQITKVYECPSSQIFFRFLGMASLLLIGLSLVTRIVKSCYANTQAE